MSTLLSHTQSIFDTANTQRFSSASETQSKTAATPHVLFAMHLHPELKLSDNTLAFTAAADELNSVTNTMSTMNTDVSVSATTSADASLPCVPAAPVRLLAHLALSHPENADTDLALMRAEAVTVLASVSAAVADATAPYGIILTLRLANRGGTLLSIIINHNNDDKDKNKSDDENKSEDSSTSNTHSTSTNANNEQCADENTQRVRAGVVARALAAHPRVLWVERRAEVKPLNKFASFVVQSGRPESHALWRRGIAGRGQVVAVADTGVDHDSCFFHDPERAIPFNKFDPAHRKIVAYHTSAEITPRDLVGGDQIDGHGTHTSGTVAGAAMIPQPRGGRAMTAAETADAEELVTYRGLVHEAKLAIFDYQHPTAQPDEMVLPDDVYTDYLKRARDEYGVRVTSNSWGDQVRPSNTNIHVLYM